MSELLLGCVTFSSDRARARRFSALLVAVWALAAARPLRAQLSNAETEEAAEFARHAAKAALSGSPRVFTEALDIDGGLEKALGTDAWNGLAAYQRNFLRAVIRDRFLHSLASPRSAGNDVAWSSAEPRGSGVDVWMGLRLSDKTLKTRWSVRRVGAGWKITDIVLSDPGISLLAAGLRSMGSEPVRRRRGVREAEEAAYPRLLGLIAIGLALALIAPRLSPPKRVLILLMAATPAILLAVNGGLAVYRTLSEPYALRETLPGEAWREAEELALEAEKNGKLSEAIRQWARALTNGAPEGPTEYQMGLAARRRGDLEHARMNFAKALEEIEPAPGAAIELASLDAAAGRFGEAEREVLRYLELSGPDPEALSLAAVLQTNLGKGADSLHSLERARALLGSSWRAAGLEAQVRARAGDAAGAVSVLRSLEAQGLIDRAVLRADPSYLRIANDPVWVAFLNERGASAPSPGPR